MSHRIRRIAILPWGDVLEDYLASAGVSLEDFATRMSGGWLFGYVEALRHAGVESVILAFSSEVDRVMRWTNAPTGASVIVSPAGRRFRVLRKARGALRACGLPRAGQFMDQAAAHFATPASVLRQQLKAHQCDAMLVQEYEDPRFDAAVALGRSVGLPVFATFQGGDWHRSPFERWFRARSMRDCAGMIVGSSTELERVRRTYHMADDKLAYIFNPLDTDLWQPEQQQQVRAPLGLPAGATVVVWHGRVQVRRKGLDVLVHAWKRLIDAFAVRNAHLLLIGDGEDRAVLRQLLDTLPPTTWTWIDRYVLDRAQMRRYLCAADIAVLPSRHEGFPVAPLEALACGLPIVACDVPGVRDILAADDPVGILVPPQEPAALADALHHLLTQPAERSALACRARPHVIERFSYDRVGEQLRRFFDRGP